MRQMEEYIASSPAAFVTLLKTVTENQKPVEFYNHRFLIDLYCDLSPDIVVRKSAQVGESTERIFKTFWCNKFLKANVIYVLPSKNVINDFVKPKVDPLIASNPHIQAMVSTDSISQKQIGDRFTYFKGAFSERDAIAISGDILILDELDRMPDMHVVNTYDSRLQASELGWRWRLSNPSNLGFGVDMYYQDSDQMHWFVKCSHCGFRSFVDWQQDTYAELKNHYVDQDKQQYACGKCDKAISDEARRMGEWIARYPSRKRRGYWISQLVAPWVSAERIIEQHEESTIEFFHNFVLGKAYTPSDLVVNRETILRATAPSIIPKLNVAMGVDQNASEQIWVAATPQGVFAHGRTKSWEELERLKLMWNAVVVADPNPYSTMPKRLAAKYNDFYLCYFKEQQDMSLLKWKEAENIVYADRTRLLDTVANEITECRLLFRERPYELEDYMADWSNLYRTTVEKPDGKIQSTWLKKDNKESDFSFATAYMRVALSRIIQTGGSEFIDPAPIPTIGKPTYTARPDNLLETDLGAIVNETLAEIE